MLNGLSEEGKNKISVYNLLSWKRDGDIDVTDIAAIGEAFVDHEGNVYPVYVKDGRHTVHLKNLPPISSTAYSLEKAIVDYKRQFIASREDCGEAILENAHIKVAIDGNTGLITSFYDKTNNKE